MENIINKEKTFYIISICKPLNGLLALTYNVINHAIYAKEQGYIPVVDLKHVANQYFKDNRIYRDNIWEYYFKQPGEYSLEDIDEDSNIIISDNNNNVSPDYEISYKKNTPFSVKEINESNIKIKNKYKNLIKFNDETQKYLDEYYNNVVKNETVLGVLCRGSDYTKRHPIGEPIQPSVNEVINKTKEVLKENPEITKIYLATEDLEIYEKFKNVFKDKLLENTQYKYLYTKDDGRFIADIPVERKDHTYKLGLEYLASMYLLSKCEYFIGGFCGGTKFVWIMSENFKYLYIWKKGHYGKKFKEHIYSVTTERSNNVDRKVTRIFGIKIKKNIKKKQEQD